MSSFEFTQRMVKTNVELKQNEYDQSSFVEILFHHESLQIYKDIKHKTNDGQAGKMPPSHAQRHMVTLEVQINLRIRKDWSGLFI